MKGNLKFNSVELYTIASDAHGKNAAFGNKNHPTPLASSILMQ
jgi:hypothetical protein